LQEEEAEEKRKKQNNASNDKECAKNNAELIKSRIADYSEQRDGLKRAFNEFQKIKHDSWMRE